MERQETYNGYCYKDINAFNNKKGICYIPNYQIKNILIKIF